MSNGGEMAGGFELIPVAIEVHEYLKKRGIYDKVRDWWNSSSFCDVIVLGASGTGKTALVKALRGLPPYVPRVSGRSDKTEEDEGKIGKTPFRFHTTPGEDLHEVKRKATIREIMAVDNPGVINVVCNGFHEPDVPIGDAVEGRTAKDTFLADRLQREIDLLDEWKSILFGPGGACSWLITVVMKSDMWWQSSDDQPVLDYYRRGNYYDALGNAQSSAHTTHSVRPYSALDQPLFGRVAMSGYYSDQLRNQHHNELIALLLERASAK
ncbi:MAG: GTPase domain-containing protein [Planctomycetaceae bacterium]